MKKTKTLIVVVAILFSANLISQIRYYASNRLGNSVNTYQEDGTFIEEFITNNSGGLENPQDILLHPDGFLLVTGSLNERIKKYDLETGDYLGDWSDEVFALGRPSKMTIGPDNLLYVTQWGQTSATAKIVRFDLNGTYLGAFTPLAPTGLGHVWDDSGNFYLAVFGINTGVGDIRKYDTNGAFIEAHIDSSVLENPSYIWWGDNDEMFVQDFTEGKVLRYNADGDYMEDYITGLNQPEGYTFLPNGNLLISERGASLISEYDNDGNYLGRWDNGGDLSGVNFIKSIDLSVLSVSENNSNIQLVSPTYGRQFYFNSEVRNTFKTINIYSLTGKFIENINLNSTTNWNASDYSEGIYLLVAISENGTKTTQKIIVN